jgi:hypothetical protein
MAAIEERSSILDGLGPIGGKATEHGHRRKARGERGSNRPPDNDKNVVFAKKITKMSFLCFYTENAVYNKDQLIPQSISAAVIGS